MKPDDIFEALTDIDDKFIAAADLAEFSEDQPVIVHPAPRKPVWKTLVPIAACLAVFGMAGMFGLKYLKECPDIETSGNSAVSGGSVTDRNGTGTQSEVRGQTETMVIFSSGYEEIKITLPSVKNEFMMEEFPNYVFRALNTGVIMNGSDMDVVDFTVIDGEVQNLYLYDLNGDGKRELCATVFENGVKRVDVVDLANNEYYTTQVIPSAPCHLDIYNDELVLIKTGIDDVETRFPFTLNELARIIPDSSKVQTVTVAPISFGMTEFLNKHFIFQNSTVYMRDSKSSMLKKIMDDTTVVYLVDLNGDGKRELVTCSGMNTDTVSDYDLRKYITVYDIENDETYFNYFDDVKVEFVNDGIVLAKNNAQTDVANSSVLTLNLLTKLQKPDYTEVPLSIDQTFTLPDFDGFTFSVDTGTAHPSFDFGWDGNSKGVGNGADRVFICDLDGDGRREIVVYAEYQGNSGSVMVYGIMDDGGVGSVEYYNKGGYRFTESGGKLICETGDDERKPLGFSRSDLGPIFTQGYTRERVDKDRVFYYSDIFQWSVSYQFYIRDHGLKIVGSDNSSITYGMYIKDIYLVPDEDNDRFFIAFTSENDGVILLQLMKDSMDEVLLRDGFDLMPTKDGLYVVSADDGELLSVPEQYDLLKTLE